MEPSDRVAKLQAMAAADPADALTWFLLGRELMNNSRHREAAEALQRCTSLNPRHTAAWRFLGDCHRLTNDLATARAIYEKGIAIALETGDLQAGKEMQAFLNRMEKS